MFKSKDLEPKYKSKLKLKRPFSEEAFLAFVTIFLFHFEIIMKRQKNKGERGRGVFLKKY